MKALVPSQENAIASPAGEEALRRRTGQIAEAVRQVRAMFGTGKKLPDLGEGEALLRKIDGLVPDAKLIEDLRGLKSPIPGRELGLALLTISESRATKAPAGDLYGRMLLEDVEAQSPSVGAVLAMARRARRTLRYRPEIAEIISILEEEEYRLSFEIEAATSLFAEQLLRLRSAVEQGRRA